MSWLSRLRKWYIRWRLFRKFAFAILVLPFAIPAHAETRQIDPAKVAANLAQAPRLSRIDADQNNKFEYAILWDADGDGDGGLVTCVGEDDPAPQCKVAGELVYMDGADDINCAIHGCGYGQMELTGTLVLPKAVVAIFPCWDVGAWRIDSNIVADPVNNCPADGINDPRAACQSGALGVRWDSSSVDTGVRASCPVDSDGYYMYVVATKDWQGTIEGQGIDLGEKEVGDGVGRTEGTTLAIDTSNNDVTWFSASGFNRALQFGYNSGGGGFLAQQAGGSNAVSTSGSKGWGRVEPYYPPPSGAGIAGFPYSGQNQGFVCVCNSTTNCNGAANQASEDGWVGLNLLDDDRLVIPAYVTPSSTVSLEYDLIIDGDPSTFTQSVCNTGYVRVPVGSIGSSTRQSGIPFGYLSENTAVANRAYHTPDKVWSANATMRNLSVQPQDYFGEDSGQCACTGAYSGNEATCNGGGRDYDCDTNPIFGMMGNGTNTVEDVVVKSWHNYAVDGGPHPGKTIFRGTKFLYGNGYAFTDDSRSWEWYDTEVRESYFSDGMWGGFSAYTVVDGFRAINNAFTRVIPLSRGNVGIRMRNMEFIDNESTYYFNVNCGASDNQFENIIIRGHRNAFEGVATAPVNINTMSGTGSCDGTALTNEGECDTDGLWQDRGGASTDYWCDDSVHDNLFRNFTIYPGGDNPEKNTVSAYDIGADTVTLTNVNTYTDCQGPIFVNLGGGATPIQCDGTACTNKIYYMKNPTYGAAGAGTVQFSASDTCATTVNITGTDAVSSPNILFNNENQTSLVGQTGVIIGVANGGENSVRNNVFEDFRIFSPHAMHLPCRDPGIRCDLGNTSNTIVALLTASTDEVLTYNTFNNNYADGGQYVGQCSVLSGNICPNIEPVASLARPLGKGNRVGYYSQLGAGGADYQGKVSEIAFCGDLAAVLDTTWWLPPISDAAAYGALLDDRSFRLRSPNACAAALGVTEDAAAVGTVDEPVTVAGDPPLDVTAMSCYTTGDVAGNITFQLYIGGASATGFACTITSGSGFENYCSVAPAVAISTAPTSIAAAATVAVGVTTTAVDNSGNDAYCTLQTRPRL